MKSIRLPVRVAYQWFIAFAVILVVPLIWYALYNAYTSLAAVITGSFPGSFNSTARSNTVTFMDNFWSYMPVIVVIPVFVWVVMATLRERRRGY